MYLLLCPSKPHLIIFALSKVLVSTRVGSFSIERVTVSISPKPIRNSGAEKLEQRVPWGRGLLHAYESRKQRTCFTKRSL